MIKTYLAHYGIKGQRWGVRRFQNEDGTLTDIGQKRYGSVNELEKDYRKADAQGAKAILDGSSSSLNTAANAVGNIGKNKSKTVKTQDYSKLSDSELREKINRLNMEKSYGELTGDTIRVRSGSDWAREILQTTGAVVAIGASIAGTIVAINSIKLGKKDGGK
jgi:hypothetical protein